MTVRDLIQALSAIDQDTEVLTYSGTCFLPCATVDVVKMVKDGVGYRRKGNKPGDDRLDDMDAALILEDINAAFDALPEASAVDEALIADIQHRAKNYAPGAMPETAGNY